MLNITRSFMKLYSIKTIASVLLSRCYFLFSDRLYLTLQYFLKLGKFIDFENPELFGEKLQYLKLYNKNPLYSKLVDKYEVKKYVSNKLSADYCIPTIGVWNNIDEIDIKELPDECVLKCTHDSGSILFYRKGDPFIDKKLKKLQKSLRKNYYLQSKEWPYRDVKHRIIAEPLMKDDNKLDLIDYKFFCFDGNPMFCQVIQNRRKNETIDWFNMDWKLMPFSGIHKSIFERFPNSKIPIKKPFCFEEMKSIAKTLSQGIPFVRIDLYEINQKVYFGEFTFFPMSGYGTFYPIQYNKILGDLINVK